MKNLFIGIDVSNDVFDYCFLTEKDEILRRGQNANTKDGIAKFCQKVKRYRSYDPWICMEHTGYYAYLLAWEFSQRGIRYSMEDPYQLNSSLGRARGKNDAVDAYRIASYALGHKHKLKLHKLPAKSLRRLKVLMKARDRYCKIKTQLKNGLEGLKVAGRTIDLEELIEKDRASIKRIEEQIKDLEKQMRSTIKAEEDLNSTYKNITSVIGVGPVTGIKCLVETGNFEKISEAKKFCCHCGLAPFEYESGSSIKGKTKTSPLCNKDLKGVLYKAACSAIQHDPQLKKYYNRKLEEGKHKLSVLNAVASKVVLRIFAVEKRGTPYVKLMA